MTIPFRFSLSCLHLANLTSIKSVYLWTCSTILDLAGVEALLVGVFHAGKDSSAAEAHRVNGTLVMEQHSVCDDLEISQKCLYLVSSVKLKRLLRG